MSPEQQSLIPFRPPVVLPHVGEKWEGFLRDYAWAMPLQARATHEPSQSSLSRPVGGYRYRGVAA
jgi:hypothetical protein